MEQLKSELRAKFDERSAAGVNICAALLFKLKGIAEVNNY